jgi:branched-chain amino acid transport system substrate-binding protein
MDLRRLCIVILVSLVLSFSCACGPRVAIKPSPVRTGEDEFSKAEGLYQKGDHAQALERYLDYVEKFPRTPYTAAAFMKIGSLYKEMGKYEDARNTYRTLINDFPDSGFVLDANVEILATFMDEKKYLQLLERSGKIAQNNYSRVQKLRILMMNAGAFLAIGERIDAAVEYFKAYDLAAAHEKEAVEGKIKNAIEGLSDMEIQTLTLRLKNPEDVQLLMAMKEATSFKRSVVACLLPLSGPYKNIGERALRGIELAFSQCMSGNDERLKITVKDEGGDPKKTVSVMEELLREKPACLIGPMMTAEEASKMAQANQTPIITLSQKEAVTDIGDFVFRNFITPEMQVRTLVSYAYHVRGAKKFAILYPKEKFGETYMNAFCDEVTRIGGELSSVEGYAPELTDFAGPVKRLSALRKPVIQDTKQGYKEDKGEAREEKATIPALDFDALFIPESAKKGAMILPQLTYYDVKNVLLLGTNLWHSDEFIKQAGNNAEGVVLTEGFFEGTSSLQVKQFVTDFMEAYGEKPQFIEAIAYDTAWMVFHVLSQGNYRHRVEIKDALIHMQPFDGVTGLTTFKENGEAEKKLYLLSVEGGRFVELIH